MLATLAAAPDRLFTELRRREFARLDRANVAYLDYTGSALYGDSQLRHHQSLLAGSVLGNPHSESGPSRVSTTVLEEARALVLAFLDADSAEYAVIFTSNASAAVKLVAESYPFARRGSLLLATDNHNSINGIREYARRAGSRLSYLPLDDELRLADPEERILRTRHWTPSLLAFPAQSNFSGVRHPLSLIATARNAGYDVLLDAAGMAPTKALSLRACMPDFVTLSFYKIFGYPTGVGALIARHEALGKLRRPWFAGGAVDYVSVQNVTHQLHAGAAGFEDGTPSFIDIAALPAGFALVESVGMPRLGAHVARLTRDLLSGLRQLAHQNQTPMVTLYGPRDLRDRGGTVAFNVVDSVGRPVPFAAVEARAREASVAIRGGCFCNPGAAEVALGLDAERAAQCHRDASTHGFSLDRFARCMGRGVAIGAVRASVGLANNDEDVRRLLAVIESFRA
jgi:selenocysteine lyase/cysteine desulfurase